MHALVNQALFVGSIGVALEPKLIGIAITEGVEKPELCRLLAAFSLAGRIQANTYVVSLASVEGNSVVSRCGERLETDRLSASLLDSLLILGPHDPRSTRYPSCMLQRIADVANSTRRLGVVGTGAFIAAEAGLLQGREASTDWRYAAHFRERFPQIPLRQGGEILIERPGYYASDRGQRTTDLALAMIEDDFGAGTARTVRFLTTINQLVGKYNETSASDEAVQLGQRGRSTGRGASQSRRI